MHCARANKCIGLADLLVAKPRNGGADTSLAVSALNFEDLTLSVGLGARA